MNLGSLHHLMQAVVAQKVHMVGGPEHKDKITLPLISEAVVAKIVE